MKKIYLLLIGLIGAHLLILSKLQFTAWPEMFSFPYLFSNGFTLYKDFVIAYPPFLIVILSFIFKIFGYKILVLKLFTWIMILLSDIYIYKIVKYITKKENYALLSVLSFVFIEPFLDGNMLWFDTFLVFPILASIFFLIRKSNSNKNILLSGLFLAIAVFSKQTALIYLLFATVFVLNKFRRIKEPLLLIIPTFIFGILFLGYLLFTNSLADFFNWNLIYPLKYWGSYPSYLQFNLRKIDYLILAGLVTPVFLTLKSKTKLIPAMFFASLMAIYPRFSYYHFAVGIALSTICFGIIMKNIKQNNYFKFIIVIFAFLFFYYQQRIVLAWDWEKIDRFFSDTDIKISQNIKTNISNNQTVYLGNIHSGVYVYAKSLPPKPWYDNYGWYLEIPGQQDKIIESWEKDPPAVIYWKKENVGEWYLPGVYKPKLIIQWIENNYTKEIEVSKDIWLWKKK